MATSKKPPKLDVATGVIWLQAFADKFHIDTAKWSVQRLDDTFRYQGLPDEAIAEKLADFIASRFRVQTHVYEPMGSRWEVVVMQK